MNGDMNMEALGYVECNGLSSATVAADRMLKTSDVKLSRIQNAKNGWITLEFKGDIAALKVAVEAAKQALSQNYVDGLVIGSPSNGLDNLGGSGVTDVVPKGFNPEKYNPDGSVKEWAVFGPHKHVSATEQEASFVADKDDSTVDDKNEDNIDTEEVKGSTEKVTCNLCGDPKCPRKLGEPHIKCIHYSELKK